MPRSSHTRFPRTGAARTPRRLTSWALGPFGTTGTISTNSTTLFSTSAQASEDGLTVVRLRGELLAALITTDAATSGWPRIGFGIAIVSENAAAVGVTAVPSPIDDIGWEGWLYHKLFALQSPAWAISAAGASSAGQNSIMSAVRFEIDNKSMRKFHNSDVMIAAIQTVSEDGTVTMEASLNCRLLVKLP